MRGVARSSRRGLLLRPWSPAPEGAAARNERTKMRDTGPAKRLRMLLTPSGSGTTGTRGPAVTRLTDDAAGSVLPRFGLFGERATPIASVRELDAGLERAAVGFGHAIRS